MKKLKRFFKWLTTPEPLTVPEIQKRLVILSELL